ncbi:hypothetical protein [Pseudonocardia sp. HH130629-09]|uniref:hypothetical protein n=1 Tax=Pseudonocardia sp. HH130629-09 TaxID=1641402 RepID=UPI00143A345D|nr:hypothetical protein [Pseudonocardia sp. HH130629-09]
MIAAQLIMASCRPLPGAQQNELQRERGQRDDRGQRQQRRTPAEVGREHAGQRDEDRRGQPAEQGDDGDRAGTGGSSNQAAVSANAGS